MSARTLALYTLQHTQRTPRGLPPPQPTSEQLERASVLSAREKLLESRRSYWNQRWDTLQANVAASIAALDPDEQQRAALHSRAQYAAERVEADAKWQELQQHRETEKRELQAATQARRQERLALNIEAQRAHVAAHYHHDLLAPYRSSVRLHARYAEVASLEETELTLRESLRRTAREESLREQLLQAATEAQRRAVFEAAVKDRRKKEHGTEQKRADRAAAQAHALHVRTGGGLRNV